MEKTYDKLWNIAYNAITGLYCHDYEGETLADLAEYLDCDIKDLVELQLIADDEA